MNIFGILNSKKTKMSLSKEELIVELDKMEPKIHALRQELRDLVDIQYKIETQLTSIKRQEDHHAALLLEFEGWEKVKKQDLHLGTLTSDQIEFLFYKHVIEKNKQFDLPYYENLAKDMDDAAGRAYLTRKKLSALLVYSCWRCGDLSHFLESDKCEKEVKKCCKECGRS